MLRYERKYHIEQLDAQQVAQIVRGLPAGFRTAYPDRQVNNIYFDTPQLTCFQDNIDGVSKRQKFRARWYGEDVLKIEQAQLEIKYKDNALGGKLHYDLEAFELGGLAGLTKQVNELVPHQFALSPSLLNSYNRAYYETLCGRFRLTIDSDLRYHGIRHSPRFSRYQIRERAIILELKYDEGHEEAAAELCRFLPFRLSKNSKYVSGVLLTS